ncbi:GPI biosynthesis protein family Pig-F-domain-containing protein [Trametes meyenii]|nr:GPI biosynthesis protein family Pig-F-domain-containing protein [Trametes meyenii]
MPSRKRKAQTVTNVPSQSRTNSSSDATAFFPFARYTSLVGVHTSLLAFSALLLPTTSTSLITKGVSFLPGSTAGTRPTRDVVQLLTEDPARTVAWICAGASILQAWWAGWVRAWSLEQRNQVKSKGNTAPDNSEITKQKLERRNQDDQRTAALGKAAAFTLAASVVFHVVTVLFGAPVTSHLLHTYLTSLLLAVLAVFPPAYTLGPPSWGSDSPSLVSRLTWVRLFAELSPRSPLERALVYPAVGAVVGSWMGAIPIGLDWERPWQAWPLTPAFGAVGGYIVGSLAALVVSATFAFAQVDREHEASQQAQAKIAKSKRS